MVCVEDYIYSEPEEQAINLSIKGELPSYVRGVLYLNGPAGYKFEPTPQRHWLDGDGMARSLTLDDGRAFFLSRYVGTRKRIDEMDSAKALYRTFGTQFEGDGLRNQIMLESPGNVSLHLHGETLLAFGEQSLPIALNPNTLETLGEFNFKNQLPALAPVSAHPRFDPDNQVMYTFGITYFGRRGRLHFYGFDSDMNLIVQGTSPLRDGNYIHDFSLSRDYACFHLSPYSLDVLNFVKNGVSLLDAMTWKEDGACAVRIISRETGQVVVDIPLKRNSFCLHHINAWQEDGSLYMDLVDTSKPFFDQYMAAPRMFSNIAPCSVLRIRIETKTWLVVETREWEAERHFDFPSILANQTTKKHRFFWAAAMSGDRGPKFYNALFRFDHHLGEQADFWQADEGCYVGGEPAVVAHPEDPNQAVVICQTFKPATGKSAYAFFDAFQLNRGPIALTQLPFYDPLGFHTSWNEF